MPKLSEKARVARQATELYHELLNEGDAPTGLEQAPAVKNSAFVLRKRQQQYLHLLNTDTPFRRRIRQIVNTRIFNYAIMAVVMTNIIIVALDAETTESVQAYENLEYFFFSVYVLEFMMKYYVERELYWISNYNRLDFSLILISALQWIIQAIFPNLSIMFLQALKGLRALRALRSISLFRSLQVIVNALMSTIKTSVLDIVLLLLLVMFLFAVIGYHLLGSNPDQPNEFSQLGSAFLTLFVFVTADGWTDRQRTFDDQNIAFNRWFVVIFVFIGNFIFTNLFIAVICKNIDEATDAERKLQREKRLGAKKYKKEVFARKQKEELLRLMAHQRKMQNSNVQEVFKSLAGQLDHQDVLPMSHLSCNLRWIDSYLITMKYHESSLKKSQQAHFQIAKTLAELADRNLHTRN